MDGFFQGLGHLINSAFGFAMLWAAMVAFFFWLASRFNPFQEKWREWEGSIITAIKLAEKQIPDGTPSGGLAKLDHALQFVLDAYAQANSGKEASAALVEQFKQAIQIKHAELDRWGGLSRHGGSRS